MRCTNHHGPFEVPFRPTHRGHRVHETVIGLFKTEVIHRDGPWRGFEDVEMATLEWVAWFNQERLLAPLGYVPPAEFEAQYYDTDHTHTSVGVLN